MDKQMLDVSPAAATWGHELGRGVAGNDLHYIRRGNGLPVVLLHGWPGFWYDWRRIIGPLSASNDVLALDFRGFGESPLPPGPPEDVSGERPLADDVAKLLGDLRLSNCIVVGFDIGAAVAQRLARYRADLVGGLVLLNPTHPGIGARRDELTLRGEFWYQQLHQLAWAPEVIARDRHTVETYLRHFYEYWAWRSDMLRPYEFDRIVDTFARPGAFEASIAWYRARRVDRFIAAGTDPATLVVTQPTEVLWSDRDPVAPAAWADGVTEFFPNATVTPVPDAGHFIAWEDPTAVHTAVDAVIARVG